MSALRRLDEYAVFRVLLGLYLTVHYVALLPWGAEVYSSEGVLPDGAASPLLKLFPNVLALADSPTVVSFLIGVAALLSVLIAFGRGDRIAAVGAWYAGACLFGRNPLTSSPHLPYLGWLLLAHALRPGEPTEGEARAFKNAGWIVLAVAYTYSGATKLVSPSWIDGSAVGRILECPLARTGVLRALLLAAPPELLRLATWTALALELGFAPMALWPKARPWIWAALAGLHVSLLFLVDFADLSLGMLLMHVFTFDRSWLCRTRVERQGSREWGAFEPVPVN